LISAAKVEASWPGIEQRMPKQGFSASNLRQSMMLLVHDRSKGKKAVEGIIIIIIIIIIISIIFLQLHVYIYLVSSQFAVSTISTKIPGRLILSSCTLQGCAVTTKYFCTAVHVLRQSLHQVVIPARGIAPLDFEKSLVYSGWVATCMCVQSLDLDLRS
jgi:hypothetical protein